MKYKKLAGLATGVLLALNGCSSRQAEYKPLSYENVSSEDLLQEVMQEYKNPSRDEYSLERKMRRLETVEKVEELGFVRQAIENRNRVDLGENLQRIRHLRKIRGLRDKLLAME